MNTLCRVLSAAALAAAGSVSAISTNTLVVGAVDWTSPTSYSEGGVPSAGDVIAFPAGTVYLSSRDAASWAKAEAASLLLPLAPDSVLDITVPEGDDATLPPPISASYVKAGSTVLTAVYNGCVVKRGSGTLRITSKGKVFGSKYPTSWSDYLVDFDVQEGTVRMVEGIANDEFCTFSLGSIHVAEGTTFYTPACAVGGSISVGSVYVRGLSGYGDISNDGPCTGRGFGPNSSFFPKHQVFHGRLRGNIRYWQNMASDCRMDFLGESSDHGSSESGVGVGTNAVVKLGNTSGPSSIGPGSMSFRPGGGTLLYLGEGETSDRFFYVIGSSPGTNYFDAGASGGLRLTGTLCSSYGTTYGYPHLVFTGSNRVESVVDCEITIGAFINGTNVNCYISKEGTGTWRFTDHRKRYNGNGFAVHGGTLAFDSLDERYRTCALGTASNLLDGVIWSSKYKLDEHQVDYALRAGLRDASATEAVLEYTGLTNAACATRPLVLDGDAHLRNNRTSALRFAGISALTAGTKVLTLDGGGTNLNEAADISDGAGQISVVKDGVGTWVLGGNQSFTGDLAVKGGKLIIRRPSDAHYTWYRWSVMEKTANTVLNVEELGLYDAAGSNLVQGITVCSNYMALGAGECALGQYNDLTYTSTSSNTGYLENLFSCAVDYGLNARFYQWDVPTAFLQPTPDDPRTWIRVYFRLREDAPRPVSYDFCNVWTKSTEGPYSSIAKRTRLEGSVDGLHWHILNENDQAIFGDDTSTWMWTFSGEKIKPANAKVHTGGKPIDTAAADGFVQFSDYEGAVSVAAGATLEVAVGSALTVRKLAVASAGMGTFRNVEFASGGVVTLETLPSESVMVPATFQNCTGLDAMADWSVAVDGEASVKCRVRAHANGIAILRPGTTLILR